MNIRKVTILILLIIFFAFFAFTGCNNQNINSLYDGKIDNNGYWIGVEAKNYVDMNTYIGLVIPKSIHTVTDQELQSVLTNLLSRNMIKEKITNKEVAYGDTLNINYECKVDGAIVFNEKSGVIGDVITIGTTDYIDGFFEQFIGHMPNEMFEVGITFPDNYVEQEFRGKNGIFTITINYIIEFIMPNLTDDFVKNNYSESNGWFSVEQMKSETMKNIQKGKISQYIQDYLIDNFTVRKIPRVIMKCQENSLIIHYQNEAYNYQMRLSDYLKQYLEIENIKHLLSEHEEDIMKTAKSFLVIQAIAEDASIKVNDSDVQQYFNDYGNIEKYYDYQEKLGMNYLRLTILTPIILDYIQNNSILE